MLNQTAINTIADQAGSAAAAIVSIYGGQEALGVDDIIGVLQSHPSVGEMPGSLAAGGRFLLVAGGASGEAVYRFLATRNHLLLPGDGWANAEPWVRQFFNLFADGFLAMARVLDPPKKHPDPITMAIAPQRTPIHDTIYERHDRGDERTGGPSLSAGAPTSTAGVPVFHGAPAPALPESAPIFGPGTTMGRPPTMAEFMAMEPEDRRPWAAIYGFNDANSNDILTSKAPPIARHTKVTVNAPEFGEDGKGEMIVAYADAHPAEFPARMPGLETDEEGETMQDALARARQPAAVETSLEPDAARHADKVTALEAEVARLKQAAALPAPSAARPARKKR